MGRVILIVCLLLAVPASASAAPVTLRDGILRYEPTAVRSSAQIYFSGSYYSVIDGPNPEPGEGCTRITGVVSCQHGGVEASIALRFGPEADFLIMRDATRYVRSTVHSGAGNDRLELGPGPDLAYGEAGDDLVFGYGGDDDLRGGEGMDLLFPGTGVNRADGGPGFDQADYNDHAEIVAGGRPSPGMRVTLASGNDAGDSRAGDRLVNVERVRGTEAGDVLVGSAGADELDGAGGADVLRGGGGDDRLIAETSGIYISHGRDVSSKRGVDVLSGGAGDDVIELVHYLSRPAHVEADRISCGSGRDSVIGAWLSSARLPADCEQLCAPACAHLAAVPHTTRSVRLRGSSVRVPVTCPSLPLSQRTCAGRIVLTARGKRLGQTRFRLAGGATARYRIRLRHRVSKLVANVESGPNALSRTVLAVKR